MSKVETGQCRYGTKCQFAHGNHEIRNVLRHPRYKTEICRTFHTIGTCAYGRRCRFVHHVEEMRTSCERTSPKFEFYLQLSHLKKGIMNPSLVTGNVHVIHLKNVPTSVEEMTSAFYLQSRSSQEVHTICYEGINTNPEAHLQSVKCVNPVNGQCTLVLSPCGSGLTNPPCTTTKVIQRTPNYTTNSFQFVASFLRSTPTTSTLNSTSIFTPVTLSLLTEGNTITSVEEFDLGDLRKKIASFVVSKKLGEDRTSTSWNFPTNIGRLPFFVSKFPSTHKQV
eukprot:TRINITY_DN11366_c0_g2_i1.p1 TRINITY_DN11366_c0_g2~~TRINITY_DN11366_c0_g2_i1.p1  ORF type:complete len:280 (-),score=30.73 TRINITY_DN11366_c0_g2_i1:382-1221(-)